MMTEKNELFAFFPFTKFVLLFDPNLFPFNNFFAFILIIFYFLIFFKFDTLDNQKDLKACEAFTSPYNNYAKKKQRSKLDGNIAITKLLSDKVLWVNGKEEEY